MRVLNIVIAKVWGGGEQYVYDTSKALKQKGIEVFIAVDKDCEDIAERFSEVANVVTFNLHTMAGLCGLLPVKNFIKINNIDIINCHSGHAMAFCLALKILTKAKLVCFKHNAIKAKLDGYHKWQRKNTDAFVCVSKLVYNLQTAGIENDSQKKFHLIYNGIDTDKYKQKAEKVFDAAGFTIGYAGRLTKDKGIEILIRAFNELLVQYPNARLLLAGSDENGYRTKLEQIVNGLSINEKVEFLGQVKDMQNFYSKLDVFVLPSIVREAFGLTICEAMYSGVPVITTDSGAQKEIITDGENGFIIPSGDINTLKVCMIKLFEDRKLASTIAKSGQKCVENNFTCQKCANNLEQLYENLTCSPKNKLPIA